MIAVPASADSIIVSSFIWTKHWNVKEDRQTDKQISGYYSISNANMTGECLTLTPSLGVIPCKYPDKLHLSIN